MEDKKLDYLHLVTNKSIKDGQVIITEEAVIHGKKGLSFKYYHKDPKSKLKVSGKQNETGDFVMTTTEGTDQKSETLTKDELLKKLAKKKYLSFVVDYIKTLKGGAKKSSRKTSRSSSRKSSRKTSRKSSRKSSRKGSRSSSWKMQRSQRPRRKTRSRKSSRTIRRRI
jgi:hypothetical protein